MALNATALQAGTQAICDLLDFASIHTAQPDAAGSNQSSAARQALTWTVTGGDGSITNVAFTGGAASGPATHVGFWSASTAGTFYGWMALTGDQTFNAAGEYTITSLSLDGTMS